MAKTNRGSAGTTRRPAQSAQGTSGKGNARGVYSSVAGAGQRRSGYSRGRADQPWWRRELPLLLSVVGIVLVVAIFIGVAANRANQGTAQIGQPVPASVHTALTSVTPETFAKVGTGGLTNVIQPIAQSDPALKGADGKPKILYVGGDYCPICASQRWAMYVALSRFGTFKDVKLMKSAANDSAPNTSTFSFHGATYTSQYIDFTPAEILDRDGKAQDTLSKDDQANYEKYTKNDKAVPYINFGNQYFIHSGSYSTDDINGLTWDDIAKELNNPNSQIAKDIIGDANAMTAAICKMTNNQPGNVCTAAPIPDMQKQLPARP